MFVTDEFDPTDEAAGIYTSASFPDGGYNPEWSPRSALYIYEQSRGRLLLAFKILHQAPRGS